MAERLDDDAVAERLADIPGWELIDGKLHRRFTFGDFSEAFGFMASLATVAERLNHHPEWSNVWNRVTIDLVTHDADGLTELDFAFAAEASRLADR